MTGKICRVGIGNRFVVWLLKSVNVLLCLIIYMTFSLILNPNPHYNNFVLVLIFALLANFLHAI